MRIPLGPIGLRFCVMAIGLALACGGCGGQSSGKFDFSRRFKKSELEALSDRLRRPRPKSRRRRPRPPPPRRRQ